MGRDAGKLGWAGGKSKTGKKKKREKSPFLTIAIGENN